MQFQLMSDYYFIENCMQHVKHIKCGLNIEFVTVQVCILIIGVLPRWRMHDLKNMLLKIKFSQDSNTDLMWRPLPGY